MIQALEMNLVSESQNDSRLKSVSLLTGSAIVVFVGLLFAIPSLLFTLGFSLSVYPFYMACAGLCYGFFKMRNYFPAVTLVGALLLFLATLVGCLFLASLFFDISWDGQTYHQESIIQLSNGWNPVFSDLSWGDPHIERSLFLWVNHYPKAAEIAAATIYKTTSSIESGKAVNLLLLCASFYLTFSALCDAVRLSLSSILLLAACAAFNPVVLYQSLSFYVDAQLASVLLCLAALLYLFYLRPVRPIGILLILIGCYLINLKFTGLIYLIIVGVGVIIIALMDNKISLARQYLKIGFATVLMGLLVFGCHPYITNFRDHGHPIFPLMGNGKVDIMTTVGPREFDNSNVNRVNKLLQSLASKSTVGKAIQAKIPFQVKEGELTAFYNADVRLGGFGPLFSGILLLFIGLLIYWAVSRQGNRNFYVITLLVFTSVLANPGAWWARYVPQLWLMPVIAAMFAIGFQKRPVLK